MARPDGFCAWRIDKTLSCRNHNTDLDVEVLHTAEAASVEPAGRDLGVELGHPGFSALRLEKDVEVWPWAKSGGAKSLNSGSPALRWRWCWLTVDTDCCE